MDKLRVLMLGWEYAPIVSGGLGVVCRDLSENLAEAGVKITFVLPKLPRKIEVDGLDIINASETIIDESKIDYVEIESKLSPYLSAKEFLELTKHLKIKITEDHGEEMYGIDLFEEVLKFGERAPVVAEEHDFDVIHAHDWMTFKGAINAKKVSKKPLIVHIHATEFERSANNPDPLIARYEYEGIQAADKVIAVSEKTKQRIIDNYHVDPDKIEVVHNAVDKIESQPKKDFDNSHQTVLFLARLAASKGADYLLNAAAKVVRILPEAKFVFVGRGGMQSELEAQAKTLGIEQSVIFNGFLKHSDVDKAYRKADLFVMPSVAEPFGITALEAIRNGTPVLMSKQSGASEVVKNALKVDFWDIDDMANKIVAVLKHRSLAKSLSDNGFKDLDRVSWRDQARKVIGVYNLLI